MHCVHSLCTSVYRRQNQSESCKKKNHFCSLIVLYARCALISMLQIGQANNIGPPRYANCVFLLKAQLEMDYLVFQSVMLLPFLANPWILIVE